MIKGLQQNCCSPLLFVPYQALSQTEQAKDTAPMNDMMRLIENYDGLRIYSLK